MKYILSLLLFSVFFGGMVLALIPISTNAANSVPNVTVDSLLVSGGKFSAEESTDVTIQSNFLKTIQVYLLGAYAVVAIGSMIFIGFKLFSAQGDPGEFKKAWTSLIYIAVGLIVAPLAYAVVRIVTGFSF